MFDHPVSDDVSIAVRNVSKSYHIYDRPQDRLFQFLFGGRRRFYQEFWALKDVSLTIRRGESVALVGRNGAGKSSLLQVISGVLRPTTGEAAVRGRVAPLLELGTSFNPEFTGLENIALSASVLGLTDEQIAERRDRIAAFADIGAFIHQPVRTYSSGMQARLAFAVAAHVDAEVLIVDEILSVGDIAFTQKCTRFIREFRERGTLLFVSHDMGAVTALCDRAVWLDGGRVIEDGEPRDVVHHYKVWMANPREHVDAQAFLASFEAGEGEASEEVLPPLPVPADSGAGPQDSPDDGILLPQELKIQARVSFKWDAPSSGEGGARISRAWIEDGQGNTLTMVSGGDSITLWIEAEARERLDHPIIGFGVKDRLGQVVFAWDTSKTDLLAPTVEVGQRFRAGFRFRFPYLAGGTYTLNLAIADGTPDAHVQHHWMYDAMEFQVQWSTVAQGLIGVPMEQVAFSLQP